MTTTAPALQVLAVAAGAAVGAVLRWLAGLAFNGLWHGFPLGTLFVNCAGGLAIGIALVWLEAGAAAEWMRLLLLTGLLGGFTTFSAFSAESLSLIARAQWGWAALHTSAHVVGALVCAALGTAIARAWFG